MPDPTNDLHLYTCELYTHATVWLYHAGVATALQIASVKQQLLRQLGEYQRLCSESQNVAELSLASSAVQ